MSTPLAYGLPDQIPFNEDSDAGKHAEVRRAVAGKLPALVGADTTYTYVYVRDAADAIARALVKKEAVGVPRWNIPEAWLMPLARAMDAVSRRTGKRPVLPLDVLKKTAAGSLLFDAKRSIEELGMAYTPLETALAEAIEEIRVAA